MLDYLIDPDPEEISPEDYGYIHERDLPDIDFLKDQILGVVDAFYKTGDVFMLESCLDEVCFELKIPRNLGNPVMKKKGEESLLPHLFQQRILINKIKTR